MSTQHHTVVLQSYRTVDVPDWIRMCMSSVHQWTQAQGWDHIVMGDEFLQLPPAWARALCGSNLYAITDLARLIWMQEVLNTKSHRVIWADADVLIMKPEGLSSAISPCRGHAFARELFLKAGTADDISWQCGVNNAFMLFDRGNAMLDHYLNACLETLRECQPGRIPRTALGPGALQALGLRHSLRLVEGIGLYTPAMLRELACGQRTLVDRYQAECDAPVVAANLCHFMRNMTPPDARPQFDVTYARAVERLLAG